MFFPPSRYSSYFSAQGMGSEFSSLFLVLEKGHIFQHKGWAVNFHLYPLCWKRRIYDFLIFCWLVISNLCVLYLNIFWWCSCSMELSRKINVLHSDYYKKLLSPNCVSIPKHILISKFFWWSLCSKGLRRNRHFALSDSLQKFCHL